MGPARDWHIRSFGSGHFALGDIMGIIGRIVGAKRQSHRGTFFGYGVAVARMFDLICHWRRADAWQRASWDAHHYRST